MKKCRHQMNSRLQIFELRMAKRLMAPDHIWWHLGFTFSFVAFFQNNKKVNFRKECHSWKQLNWCQKFLYYKCESVNKTNDDCNLFEFIECKPYGVSRSLSICQLPIQFYSFSSHFSGWNFFLYRSIPFYGLRKIDISRRHLNLNRIPKSWDWINQMRVRPNKKYITDYKTITSNVAYFDRFSSGISTKFG